MKRPRISAVAIVALITVCAGTTSRVAAQQSRLVTASVIPALPPAPANPVFADELAGRRLLYAARDAYRAAPALRWETKWFVCEQRASEASSAQSKAMQTETGRETIAAEPGARRLSLTTQTMETGEQEIRRFVSNGASVLATRYDANPGDKTPTRTFVRFALNPEDTLRHALRKARIASRSRAATLLLDDDWSVRSSTRRGTRQAVEGVLVDEVWEREPAQDETLNDVRVRERVTRRYLLDAATHFVRRYEEWTTRESQTNRVRGRPRAFPALTYVRENYLPARVANTPLPGALFAQAVPARYGEAALPSVDLPDKDDRPEADAEARRLLDKWARAHDRMLSFFAQIEVARQRPADASAEAAPSWSVLYTAWLHKPGRARLTLEMTGVPDADRRSQTAVSDGEHVTVYDRRRNRVRTSRLDDPSEVGRQIDRAGFDDMGNAVEWLWAPPLGAYDQAAYRGRQNLEGEAVDVLELFDDEDRLRFRPGDERRTVLVALGRDGLPREVQYRRERSLSDIGPQMALDRVTSVRYRQVRVDEEPPQGSFTFKPPANATRVGR